MKISNRPPKNLIKNLTAKTVAQVLKPKKFVGPRSIRSDSVVDSPVIELSLPVPEGSNGHADFVSEVYYDGASLVTLADIIDKPGKRTGQGLVIQFIAEDEADEGIVHVIGPLLAKTLTGNWTIVVEFEVSVNNSSAMVFTVASDPPLWTDEIDFKLSSGTLSGTEWNSGVLERGYTAGGCATGVHKLAVTRTNSVLHSSLNGEAVRRDEAENASPNFVPTSATFGGFNGDFVQDNIIIKKFTIYETPANDSTLVTLSTP